MKNAKSLNIGIIGAARVAVYAMIAPAKENSRAEVVAIAARDPVRALEFAATHNIGRVHESYDALIGDPEIDLVYVATPPAFHAENALKALRAGKDVLVEKPFAMNAREAAQVVAQAAKSGRRVFEAFHYRHHAMWHRIVDIVRGGQLGDIKMIDAAFDAPIPRAAGEFRWDAKLGGGALMDLGCYALQWVRVVAGQEPTVGSARMRMVDGVDVETRAQLRFAGGAAAQVSCRMDGDAFRAFLNVDGTRGSLRVFNPLAPQMGHRFDITINGQSQNETFAGPSTFAAQLDAVVAALLDGATFPLASDDPVRSMAAIDDVRAAAGD